MAFGKIHFFALLGLAVVLAGCLFGPTVSDDPAGGLPIKILAVGHASLPLKQMLQSEDFRIKGIQYATDLRQDFIVPGVLDGFDVIILQGSPVCDRTAREVIADRVKEGGKLIVIGDACTRMNDDPNAIGWSIGNNSLGDVIPVTYRGKLHTENTNASGNVQASGGKYRIVAVNHPMFNGIYNFSFSGTVTEVLPNANAKVLAYIDNVGGRSLPPATFGIIESQGVLSGKTIYFSFDPGTTISGGSRNIVLNTLLYLKGAKD